MDITKETLCHLRDVLLDRKVAIEMTKIDEKLSVDELKAQIT